MRERPNRTKTFLKVSGLIIGLTVGITVATAPAAAGGRIIYDNERHDSHKGHGKKHAYKKGFKHGYHKGQKHAYREGRGHSRHVKKHAYKHGQRMDTTKATSTAASIIGPAMAISTASRFTTSSSAFPATDLGRRMDTSPASACAITGTTAVIR